MPHAVYKTNKFVVIPLLVFLTNDKQQFMFQNMPKQEEHKTRLES